MHALLPRLSLLGLLVAVNILPLGAAIGQPYLPLVGPPPLRFSLPPPPPPASPVALPPLALTNPAPLNGPSEPPGSINPTPAASRDQGPLPPASSATEANHSEMMAGFILPLRMDGEMPTAPPPPGSSMAAEGGLLTPQMFLKYFSSRPGTNSSGITILTPVPFVPPQPLAPPSSSATFQTTPPGKP